MTLKPIPDQLLAELAREVAAKVAFHAIGFYRISTNTQGGMELGQGSFFPKADANWEPHTYFEPWEDALRSAATSRRDAIRLPKDLPETYEKTAILIGVDGVVGTLELATIVFTKLSSTDEAAKIWESKAGLASAKLAMVAFALNQEDQ